ncbi:hypothetical protein H6G54_05295 [Anabaena cylindrica FACHB-243]|uniref:Uncharacterized protein n=1 Tax=Anabaena cylindrica (strain ATCC 27899 / PCC 7122) TaxID=272123 RepID=K9ZNM9_ANACC|nr:MULTISPECIES: hypothetical protein [Anabaena]AFZ60838.1 hypothetical protein Anacy_5526 [Anabaena cylindrica PCC 7122]MBD2417134.1 hypothetical protein [Anabaena cylindrica FACHB-243]MBY5280830.1 hypothetical protein [Anabaena sp. CCAP 1446/1C]MBY5307106.1 hypothetical protein [Anabaena sp. CCAP 1446/1C]MCM2406835.1 hypothetical protein [Anabaena sp. CCAP 1446/1C]
MDSEQRRRYQTMMLSTYCPETSFLDKFVMRDGTEKWRCSQQVSHGANILASVHGGKVFIVNSRKRNGLILFKPYHAEFAGPGAVVGGDCDSDCQFVLPIGNLSLLDAESYEDRQKAYLIRRQWIRLIKQITENSVSSQRVQKILDQFEQYFPADVVADLPDVAFAMLVGVLPQTVAIVRRLGSDLDDYMNNHQ